MPRNGSGTHSIPNTFTASTLVRSADVNDNFTDIATELTNSLARDGQSTMTGQFKAYSGTVSAPGQSWASELGSGWYRAGAGDFRKAISGVDVLKVTSAGFTITGNLTVSGTISGTFTVADGAITTAKIADANVTFAKLDTAALASQAEAEAGSSSTKLMTPQRVSQAIAALTTPPVLVRRYFAQYSSYTALSAALAATGSGPVSTDGTQIISQAVVVDNSTQRVRMTFLAAGGVSSASATAYAAIFNGSTLIGARGVQSGSGASDSGAYIAFTVETVPGSAGTFTYTVRAGASTGSLYLNGNAGTSIFPSNQAASLVVEVLSS